MSNLFYRLSNGDYQVPSRSSDSVYKVTMFGLDAIACECAHNSKGHRKCKHMEVAEVAEALYQEKQRASSPPEHSFLNAELTRPAGFSLLKQ